MKKAFQNTVNYVLCGSILAIIIGCILIFFPNMSLKALGIISAIYLILHGCVLLALETRITKVIIPFESILTGVLSIILGLVLLVNPGDVSVLITIAIGIWIIVSSFNNIKIANFFRKIEEFPSTLMIILSVLNIILGCLVILNPFEASVALTLYLGIILIVNAIFNIADMIILKKNVKDKENVIKEKMNELVSNID